MYQDAVMKYYVKVAMKEVVRNLAIAEAWKCTMSE